MTLNELVFVDCYILSHDPPARPTWRLVVEGYRAVKNTPAPAVEPGGPRTWTLSFMEIDNLDDIEARGFERAAPPGHEWNELYELRSRPASADRTEVVVRADGLEGRFTCSKIRIEEVWVDRADPPTGRP